MLQKMSLFSPCRRSQNPTQKSGAKKWCKKVGTRLSVQGVIDFCSDLDKVNRAAVSLWLSRHLDSHGSERLWSIRESHLGVFPSDGRLLTGTAHLVSERDPVRMLTQRRPMSW